MYEHTQMQDLKRHPIRGALYGLVFGLGVALFLIGQKIIAFGTLPPILVLVGGLVLGLLWSLFGPAKEATGGPPVPYREAAIAPEVRLGDQWADNPALAPEGQYGVPIGGTGVPGGEYAEPIAPDAPAEPQYGQPSPPPSAPSSPPPPPPPRPPPPPPPG